MFNVLQVTSSAVVLQHQSSVQNTAGIATSQRCSMYCRSPHIALQYCNITAVFNVLQYCNITAMFKVLRVTTSRAAVLQHHSDVQSTAGHISRSSTATPQQCSMYCRSQHHAQQYCNITAMFNLLQITTSRAAGLQHHIDVQCTASIATSHRCSMYCKYCNITAMFNVLQVLQHHSDVQCTASHNISLSSTETSQRCSMYCRSQHLEQQYCSITAMFNVLQVTTSRAAVLQRHSDVQCAASHNISRSSTAASQLCSMYCGSHLEQ